MVIPQSDYGTPAFRTLQQININQAPNQLSEPQRLRLVYHCFNLKSLRLPLIDKSLSWVKRTGMICRLTLLACEICNEIVPVDVDERVCELRAGTGRNTYFIADLISRSAMPERASALKAAHLIILPLA